MWYNRAYIFCMKGEFMAISNEVDLICPIRGKLNSSRRSKDKLTASEEYYRIEAIKFMISKGYPKENFYVESVLKRFGRDNRNSFRCDFVILDVRLDSLPDREVDTILQHAIVLAEIKRDNAKEDYVKNTQVKPMLDFSKNLDSVAVYWDNLNQRVFWHIMVGKKKEEKEGPLSFFPAYGNKIEVKPITYNL